MPSEMLTSRVVGACSFLLRLFILWQIYLNGTSVINVAFPLMKKNQ